MNKVVPAIAVLILVIGLWALNSGGATAVFPVEPAPKEDPPKSVPDSERAHVARAPAPKADSQGASQKPGHQGKGHGDRATQDRVRFDLTIPEEERTFCDHCDPYRVDLGDEFDRGEKQLLDRAAQFSEYTKSEVWRLVSGSPKRMAELQDSFRPLVGTYEARSSTVFAVRQKFGEALIAEGKYQEYVEQPDDAYSDESLFVVRVPSGGRHVFRVAALTAGLDSNYDRAMLRRDEAMAAMLAFTAGLFGRYRAEDIR